MADVKKKCSDELFKQLHTKYHYNIPNEWNKFINLQDSKSIVDETRYNDCVLKAKKAILQAADEDGDGIKINKDEFLKLTFQPLPKQPWFGRDPRLMIQTSLYQINVTESHIRERYILFGGNKANLPNVFKKATFIFINDVINDIDDDIKTFVENVFLCGKKYAYFSGEKVACQLLLYVVLTSVSKKSAESATLPGKNNEYSQDEPEQNGNFFRRFMPRVFHKNANRGVVGGKKSRAKKRRNRKTSRRCK